MKSFTQFRGRMATALLPVAVLAACAQPAPEPTPPPPEPAATPANVPPPATQALPVTQAPANWLDQPRTPGDWTYRDGPSVSYATYGESGQPALFGMECVKARGTVQLVRGARAADGAQMRIRTETGDRTVAAQPSPDGRPILIAPLPARDSILEAMAFTKGRFAIETTGLVPLYIPAWPEVTRIIEDCR